MKVIGYKIYFWSNEDNEPIHVHLSKGNPVANSTKIWITKNGGCILANNNSKIPENDLNKLIDIISRHYFLILSKWKEFYNVNEVKFYC
ncbi:MAG: DUF4160 domain-containing protein [Clostridia bacterium]|nr:DUF4160 domain-containing protein [Clostridia bacterium]